MARLCLLALAAVLLLASLVEWLPANFAYIRLEVAAALASAAFLLLPVLPSLVPPWFYDALLYHLEAPELSLRSGRLAAVPYNFYLDYPLNMSALYLAARAVAPSPLASPALLHVVFL